jgi:hypothetical protein
MNNDTANKPTNIEFPETVSTDILRELDFASDNEIFSTVCRMVATVVARELRQTQDIARRWKQTWEAESNRADLSLSLQKASVEELRELKAKYENLLSKVTLDELRIGSVIDHWNDHCTVASFELASNFPICVSGPNGNFGLKEDDAQWLLSHDALISLGDGESYGEAKARVKGEEE